MEAPYSNLIGFSEYDVKQLKTVLYHTVWGCAPSHTLRIAGLKDLAA